MPLRTGTDEQPLTRKEADALLAAAIAGYIERHPEAQNDSKALPVWTCSTCPLLAWCKFAYDQYNTDGDCLAMK